MKPPKVDRGGSDEKARAAPVVKPQQEEKKRGGWGNMRKREGFLTSLFTSLVVTQANERGGRLLGLTLIGL